MSFPSNEKQYYSENDETKPKIVDFFYLLSYSRAVLKQDPYMIHLWKYSKSTVMICM
jgi:hypothetical protein